jgi:exodeoxyribonuclease VII large subunit
MKSTLMSNFDELKPRAWTVSALCRAVADSLDAQFNPVAVRGEISSFSRAASGHCYFSIKDDTGQIRCAMFRRAASLMDFSPRDGELVEVRGRLGVYEARGDLQLVVESMERAGQGALFEQFLRLKAKLEAEGLFDPIHKRALPEQPRAIGVVTSLGAAAWHDVMTALQRRVPHIPVLMAPALVQGAGAAAAEMAAADRGVALQALSDQENRLNRGLLRQQDRHAQRLDSVATRLGVGLARQQDRQSQRLAAVAARLSRPQAVLGQHAQWLDRLASRLQSGVQSQLTGGVHRLERLHDRLGFNRGQQLAQRAQGLERAALRLSSVDPHRVLDRGYAWLSDENGHALTKVAQFQHGQSVQATLADGEVPLLVKG